MKRLLILFAIFSLLFSSCSKPELDGSVLIRINNLSVKRIDNSRILSFSPDGQTEKEKNYGSVLPGTASSYKGHQKIYNALLYKFTLEGFGVIEVNNISCAIGLRELPPGKYSLTIEMDSNNPYIHLVKD